MATISNILTRLNEMASRIGKFSIGKDDFFDLLRDIVNRQQTTELNMSNLSIRKIYATVAAMNADVTAPTDEDGEAILDGQLVATSDTNEVYRYDGDSWEFVAQIGDLDQFYTKTEVDTKDASLLAASTALGRDLLRIHDRYLIYKGIAYTSTVPAAAGSNLTYIAAETGVYSNFSGLEGITITEGQFIIYNAALARWVLNTQNVYYNMSEINNLLDVEINKLNAIAAVIIALHDSHCTSLGWAHLGTQDGDLSISGLAPGDPEIEYPAENVDAYVAYETGEFINLEGIDGNPITASAGQIIRATPDGWIVANVTDAVKYVDGVWTVLSKYSLQDLREYTI